MFAAMLLSQIPMERADLVIKAKWLAARQNAVGDPRRAPSK